MIDGSHRNFFGSTEEGCLGLGVAHGLDTAVPLNGIHAEDGLVQRQCQRHGHEAVTHGAVHLAQKVERRVQRERTARQPDILVDRELAAHLHVVVAHEGIRTVVLLVGVVALVIRRQGSRQVHFRQQVGTEGAVLPVGGFQFVQGHSSIHTLHASQQDSLIQRDGTMMHTVGSSRSGGERCQRHPCHQQETEFHSHIIILLIVS